MSIEEIREKAFDILTNLERVETNQHVFNARMGAVRIINICNQKITETKGPENVTTNI